MTPKHNFKRVLFSIICVSIAACSTTNITDKQNKTGGSDAWDALSQNPASIGAAINGARVVLGDYDRKLSGADRTRRGFNLATIASTTYTAVGAALNVHNHNLIASTALTTILPSLEENVQTHGSPETLGTAMTKTQCIIRAGSLALEPDTLAAASALRLKIESQGQAADTKSNSTMVAYDAVAHQIVSAYGQIYIDYAVNRTPAQLSTKDLSEKLKVISQAEAKAADQAEGLKSDKKSLFNVSPAVAAVDLSKQIGLIEASTKASMTAISNCLKAP